MEIIENNKIIKKFSEIKVGDIFQYNNLIYLKLNNIIDISNPNVKTYISAVSLNDGTVFNNIGDNAKVILFPKPKLILNN